MSTSTSALQDKLAKLSADNEFSNKGAEEYNTPFPLYALLILYNKANHECYIDYMFGFKLLRNWLTPILSPNEKGIPYYHDVLTSYETKRLAELTNNSEDLIIHTLIENIRVESIPK